MLKITPSKGKGDKNKPTDTNLGTKDLPADGNSQVIHHISKQHAWFLIQNSLIE